MLPPLLPAVAPLPVAAAFPAPATRCAALWLRARTPLCPHPAPPSTPLLPLQGRMHSNGKGISDSALPYKRTAPSWFKQSADEIVTKSA